MSEIVAEIDLSKWNSLLHSLEKNGKNAVGILKAVFNTFGFKEINDHFREERGPDGKWKKRSAITQKIYADISSGKRKPPRGYSRAAFNPSNKILQLTGTLRGSMLPQNVRRLTSNSIMIFTPVKYSGKHDRGEDKMPKRTFMWMGDPALRDMAEAAASMWVNNNGI